MSWWFKVFLLLVGLGLCSCGYTLNHRLKNVFHTERGIYVPVFDNMTDQTGAEIIFTNAMIRELASRHEIILSSRKEGGLELHGSLVRIDVVPTIQSALGFGGLQSYRRIPTEIGISVTMLLSLIDDKGKVIWAKQLVGFRRVDGLLTRTYDYQAASSVGMYTQSLVESVYPEIADLIVRDAYDEMIELF